MPIADRTEWEQITPPNATDGRIFAAKRSAFKAGPH
jgi:hypothetical protein